LEIFNKVSSFFFLLFILNSLVLLSPTNLAGFGWGLVAFISFGLLSLAGKPSLVT
jgi:hypothetical protein